MAQLTPPRRCREEQAMSLSVDLRCFAVALHEMEECTTIETRHCTILQADWVGSLLQDGHGLSAAILGLRQPFGLSKGISKVDEQRGIVDALCLQGAAALQQGFEPIPLSLTGYLFESGDETSNLGTQAIVDQQSQRLEFQRYVASVHRLCQQTK
jgi:hypothetical protein